MIISSVLYFASYIAAAVLCLGALVGYVLEVKKDPLEPQYIPPRVPIIGHVLGIFLQKQQYYVNLRLIQSLLGIHSVPDSPNLQPPDAGTPIFQFIASTSSAVGCISSHRRSYQ